MDMMEQAAALKERLVAFALSPRFARELDRAFQLSDPDGLVEDEATASMIVDHFALQHRLASGDTVIDAFLRTHPDLSPQEQALLLSWKDVVEGIFEVRGKDQEALTLFNLVDELVYRARSNMGMSALHTIDEGMFLICRLVPLGDGWMISADISVLPADARDEMFSQAAEVGLRKPALVFRNQEKLATARRLLAKQREVFIDLYGAEYVVVPTDQLRSRLDAFWRALMDRAQPGAPPRDAEPDEPTDAETVAIHFDPETGISLYFDFGLLQELFANPSLIGRRRYRETLSSYLRSDDISPAAIRLLTGPDPDNASVVFGKLLKKKNFSWPEHGESLLRRYKARYFETPPLPTTVPVSDTMARHLRERPA
ncbi:hypothetical protein [Nonomuraea aridisoli]|uniref:Uncharacterized protein n=1 Tax=Nonomuraea aridisoli TaxID=2070368 RepID=A0A2W2G8X2_9ACTN|nr:hypothetical protein [Nonomuraea aridisoli]PZG23324.1 hypothetical protein C1J01_01455 [Nonomuraea aridisoli]